MLASNTKRKVKKESFMQGVLVLMFSQVLIKLLGFLYKIYLSNKDGFGDAGNAIYGAGYQIYALLLSISSIGVPNAVAKLISERMSLGDIKGAHRIFKIAFATFGVIGLIGTAILLFGAKNIAYASGMPAAEMTLVALSPSIFFVSVMSVIRGFFNGRSKIKVTAHSQTLEQIFKTVFTIVVVEIIYSAVGANTTLMAAGANLATTMAVVGSFIYLLAYYKIHKKDKIDMAENASVSNNVEAKTTRKIERDISNKTIWQIVKAILLVSIPISVSSILVSINKNIDTFTVVRFMEGIVGNDAAVKQYGILNKIETLTSLPLSFNVAFATALVPAITAARTKGTMEQGVKRISFSLLTTIIIVLPCVVGMVIFADPILHLIVPNAPDGAWVFQVCVIATIFTAMEQTINGALQGLGKVFVPAIALTIGVLLKCVLNVILIPNTHLLGGAAGAAFATDVCHITAFLIVFMVLRRTVDLKLSFSKMVVKPLLAALCMGVVSYGAYIGLSHIIAPNQVFGIVLFRRFIGISGANLVTIIALLTAVVTYVASILILKIFNKEDILMLPAGGKIYSILQKMGIYKEK